MTWTAAAVCPRPGCPSDTADADPILQAGVVVALWLTCRICGTSHLVPHHDATIIDQGANMTVRDVAISAIKTIIQVIVAALLTWATPVLDWIAAQGVQVDRTALEAAAFALLVGVVAGLLNEAGRRWPWVNRILSVGLADKPPTY